jgi:hypothetical protein
MTQKHTGGGERRRRIERVIDGEVPLWMRKVINRREPLWTLELPEGYWLRQRPDLREGTAISLFLEDFV